MTSQSCKVQPGVEISPVVERFQREAIYRGFASGRLQAIATFQRQATPKRWHVGMLWNMYVAEGQRGTGLTAALFHHVLEVASREVDQVDLYVAVENAGLEVLPKMRIRLLWRDAARFARGDYDALMMTRKFR